MSKTKKPTKPVPKGRYTLIKGQFWIHNPDKPRQGPQPDGDTVGFIPDSVDLVRQLRRISGRAPDISSGRINVRYEGIDALETHFQGVHQALALAHAARDVNLARLGFKDVMFFADLPEVVQSVTKNPLPGYVLANGIEANGRLLGLVYAGATSRPDGQAVFVDNALLDQSVNARLVAAGLAYVEPYDSMPMALVTRLRSLVTAARGAKLNPSLWPLEAVSVGKKALLRNSTDLRKLVMWPKLFRRLAAYFAEGHVGLSAFDAWIRDDKVHRDDALRLPDGEQGNMHDTYQIGGDRLQLKFLPEQLLITPDPKPPMP